MAKEPANPLLEDDWEEISTGIGNEWDFNVHGGTLIATYEGVEFMDIPEEKQRENADGTMRTRAKVFRFVTADSGESVFLWESHQLNEAFEDVNEGDLVKVQFDGYKSFTGSDGPRQIKQYKVSRKAKK